MKKILSFLVFGLALLVSCEKEGPTTVNHIDNLYNAPADATTMTLSGAQSTWSTDRRYFDLNFSNLSTTLVGYDALLAPGQYVIGGDQIGNAINTKVGGSNASNGFITVNEKDGQYAITATIGGQVYYWTGSLPFTPDPAPKSLTEVMSAQSNVPNGTKSVTMSLATPGISQGYDENWQQVWTGEGGYLALDLYSEDGYLHDGTYKASAQGGVIEPGEFGIGWDPGDLYGIGWVFTDWGTCWWDVKDGKATATKITNGLVNVSSREEKVDGKDVTIWTIAWGVNYPVEVLFEGAIPTLTKPKKPSGPVAVDYTYTIGEPQACILNDNTTVVEGVKKYPFTFTDKDGQEVAYLEFVLAEGATDVEEGDYVSTEYAHEVGQLANGYYMDFSEYGWGIIAGGSYYIDGGEKVYIDPGVTVTVTNVGTGAFRFTSNGFDFAAGGPNYVPGGGGEGDDDVVILTKFANLTDYAMFGMNMLALEFCTDGLTPTAGWFGATYAGDGNYLKLEIYAEGGVLAPGTYVPNEIGTDAVNVGQFKGGYDPEGAKDYGTNWFTVVGGTGTSAHITDGTVTVTQDGDNYTIVVESTAIKCKYVGPLE